MLTQEDAKRIFSDVDTKHQFWLKDIGPVKNLKELLDSLKTMDELVFKHHVTKDRNDFSNWIRDTIGDKELADSIAKTNNKKKMAKIIDKRISKLKKMDKDREKKEKKHKVKVKKIRIGGKKEKKEGKKEVAKELPDIDIKSKIDEILQKEKEIEKREEVIEKAEERIEKKLSEKPEKKKFFSKEFTQGIIIGILFSLIIWLLYNAFLNGMLQ